MTYKQIILYTIIGLCFATSVFFVNHNDSFYESPIAEVIDTKLEDTTKVVDMYQNRRSSIYPEYNSRIEEWKRKRTAYPFN